MNWQGIAPSIVVGVVTGLLVGLTSNYLSHLLTERSRKADRRLATIQRLLEMRAAALSELYGALELAREGVSIGLGRGPQDPEELMWKRIDGFETLLRRHGLWLPEGHLQILWKARGAFLGALEGVRLGKAVDFHYMRTAADAAASTIRQLMRVPNVDEFLDEIGLSEKERPLSSGRGSPSP